MIILIKKIKFDKPSFNFTYQFNLTSVALSNALTLIKHLIYIIQTLKEDNFDENNF